MRMRPVALALAVLMVSAVRGAASPAWAGEGLEAPAAGRIVVTFNPAHPVLGRHSDISVVFTVLDAGGAPVRDADLAFSASVGRFDELRALDPGRYSAAYLLPQTRFPHVALCAVVDRKHPGTGRLFAIPLTGVSRFPVEAPAGLSIDFEVAGKRFGPFRTDESGQAQVSLEVPPGTTQARVIGRRSDGRGEPVEQVMSLPLPAYQRIKLLPPPELSADGESATLLRMLVLDPRGMPALGAQVEASAALGVVGQPLEQGDGIYVARYVPPRLTQARTETLTVRLPGQGPEQEERLSFGLRPVAPPPDGASQAVAPFVVPSGEPSVAPPERPLQPIEGRKPSVAPSGEPSVAPSERPPQPIEGKKPAMAPSGEPSVPPPERSPQPIDGQKPSSSSEALIPPGSAPSSPQTLDSPGLPTPRATPGSGTTGIARNWTLGSADGGSIRLGLELPRRPGSASDGLRVYPLVGLGTYRFRQNGLFENATVPLGETVISVPALPSAGVGLEWWATARYGLTVRYEAGYYSYETEAAPPATYGDIKQIFGIEGRARLPFALGSLPLAAGARLGVGIQDHPALEKDGAGGVTLETGHVLPLWLTTLDIQAFPRDDVDLWASWGPGFHLRRLGQVSQRLELGGLYRLSASVAAGGAVELWQRHLSATRISDGATVGTLEDLWVQLIGFVAMEL